MAVESRPRFRELFNFHIKLIALGLECHSESLCLIVEVLHLSLFFLSHECEVRLDFVDLACVVFLSGFQRFFVGLFLVHQLTGEKLSGLHHFALFSIELLIELGDSVHVRGLGFRKIGRGLASTLKQILLVLLVSVSLFIR